MQAKVLRSTIWRGLSPCRKSFPPAKAGLNFLEWAGKGIPQGPVVKSVKTAWKWTWLTLMRELAPQSESGAFVRAKAAFHKDIGTPNFPVDTDRYHVYVGNACPWCHRVVLAIILLGLEDVVSIGQLQDDPERASRGGWVFDKEDPITGCKDLRCVYDKCCGEVDGYQGRCTAPLLIDKKQMKIVSNESSLILKNLNDIDFQQEARINLRPAELLREMDDLNEEIYDSVNNGVYKCGFATSQEAYNEASDSLFAGLDKLEERLLKSRFLFGEKFTESDLRLYPTLIRFDSIYATVFRCSKKRLSSYPSLTRWLKDMYSLYLPSSKTQIKDSIDLKDARRSYCELFPLNPSGIVVDGADEAAVSGYRESGLMEIRMNDIFYMKEV